jgi:hypothetical protein
VRVRSLLFVLVCALSSWAQDASSISGAVVDPSGAFVPGAELTLVEPYRRLTRVTTSNEAGLYSFDGLIAGLYTLSVKKDGFRSMEVGSVALTIRDTRSVRVRLEVNAASGTSVTVTDRLQGLSTDVSTGTSLEGKQLRELPVNGRDVQSLVRLAPGITSSNGPNGPEINANGLRSNTNYYTVDGVSANTGISAGGGGGPIGGLLGLSSGTGSSTAQGATGQSSSLITMDAMQEMRVQTSAFAPEFGRSPGAQISITSRAGSNAFHGSLFGYFRNQRFNANDWFANQAGIGRASMRQNNIGAVLGGRVLRDRTFFFLSFENNNVKSPQTAFVPVPDAATRASAPADLRPWLNAFPRPNGSATGANAAQFTASWSNPSEMMSMSARLDHTVNARNTFFARYSMSPSHADRRGGGLASVNSLTRQDSRNNALTAAWLSLREDNATNDLRVNYTGGSATSSSVMDNFGGAVPLSTSQLFPAGTNENSGVFSLQIFGLGGYSVGQGARNEQKQINVVDAWSKTIDRHQHKVGVDWRRTMPTYNQRPYSSTVTFNGLTGETGSFLSGTASNGIVSSTVSQQFPVFSNFSSYWQDTWRATDRTTVTWGVRWDVNPAPGVRKGEKPLAVGDGGLTQDRALYGTRWFNFAPRLGVAYQLDDTPNREMMFRGGLGVFFDVGYGATTATFSGAPYANVRQLTEPRFPFAELDREAPVLPPTAPYGQVSTADQNLLSPRVYQWQMAVERFFGPKQSLEVGWTGSKGTRLLRQETQPLFSDGAVSLLRLTTNGADSTYNGLNVQYRRRITASLQLQTSYTWSHSIDSASTDFSPPGFALLTGGDRASSNFDIRHNFNVAGSWRLPSVRNVWLRPLLNNWWSDFIATGRTGLPFDVQSQTATTSSTTTAGPFGNVPRFFGQVRPNYNGLPVYIDDPNAPGGRRLNRAAFSTPSGFGQGTLGRNIIRGFGMRQLDLTFRRDIQIREATRLQFRLEGYNVLNTPSFANPLPNEGASLASSNFGVMSRMLNSGFGGTSIYSQGGPRTMQAVIRFEF